jgi:hypothetical protein
VDRLRSKNVHLIFRWVPAHAGVKGNEVANKLAMEQTVLSYYPGPKGLIPHQLIPRQSKTHQQDTRATFQSRKYGQYIKTLDRALPGQHTRKLYNTLTRTQAAVLSQMRSGYCRLNSYLYKIKAAETDKCQCGKEETVKHFILEYPQWTEERARLNDDIGRRANELSYLLGGYQDIGKDGELAKWSPDIKAVRRTIKFVQETGRLEEL